MRIVTVRIHSNSPFYRASSQGGIMTSMRSRTLTDTDLRTLADGFGTPL